MKASMVKATRPGNSMTPENILVAQKQTVSVAEKT